jgi:dinuclear metal center YbgI/SA1388 family protein
MPPRPSADLKRVAAYLDRILRSKNTADWDGAVNGLQVENRGRVHKIAAAVDGRLATIQRAAAEGVDLLLVHHGLFWGATVPWIGPHYRLLRQLLDRDIAVYSAHLPLDEHPRLGNNVLLARALGFRRLRPFFACKGRKIGVQTVTRVDRKELGRRLAAVLGAPPLLLPGGPPICCRIGVVTGGAGAEMRQAAAEGVDTFITGEGPHWTHALADELGLNVFYGGHYATETFGVKALASALADEFRLPQVFINHPTGL